MNTMPANGRSPQRRQFCQSIGLALAASLPPTLWAQSAARVPRIGVLRWGEPGDGTQRNLTEALAAIGYRESVGIHIEWRYAQSSAVARRHAAELVAQTPDLLVGSATPACQALRDATTTIPIVLASSADPVGAGLVRSLAHPGGNVTGMSSNLTGLVPKQVELLRDLLPSLRRVAFLGSSEDVATPIFRERFRSSAQAIGLQGQEILIARADEIAGAADAILRAHSQAVVVQPLFAGPNARQVADALLQRKLPSVSGSGLFVRGGGLLSYHTNQVETWKRAASFIDRVLKGARPADLPIEDPTRFELSINVVTARALGITVPQSLLLRADEVIQ